MALLDHPAETDLAIINAQIEAAVGIGADPGFVGDWRTFAAVIGEWNQRPVAALLASRPFDATGIGHARFLPTLPRTRRALGPGDTLPDIRLVERLVERIYPVKVLDLIARLR